MASLTLDIDDDLLRRARVRALKQHTSVEALVRDWLERFASEDLADCAVYEGVRIENPFSATTGGRG